MKTPFKQIIYGVASHEHIKHVSQTMEMLHFVLSHSGDRDDKCLLDLVPFLAKQAAL